MATAKKEETIMETISSHKNNIPSSGRQKLLDVRKNNNITIEDTTADAADAVAAAAAANRKRECGEDNPSHHDDGNNNNSITKIKRIRAVVANEIICSSLPYIVPLQEDKKKESIMIGKIRIVVDGTIIDSSLLYIVNSMNGSQGRVDHQLNGSIFGSNGICDSSDNIIHQESPSSLTMGESRLRTRATKKRKTKYNNNISTKFDDNDSNSSNETIDNNNNSNQDNHKRKRSLNKNETSWNNRLLELIDFRDKFNHTNVPDNYAQNKPLGRWVGKQRLQYKLNEKGEPNTLTKERIESLNKHGFKWRCKKQYVAWEYRWQQLVDFKGKFNHTNVTKLNSQNKQLITWVESQRAQYNPTNKKGESSPLTKERIEALNNLGFRWKKYVAWEDRWQQLVDFKDKFHHTNVPKNYAQNITR